MKKGTFDLHTLSGDKAEIEALLIPEISTGLKNHVDSHLLTLPYLKGLRLAHPVSNDACYDIDILIGADYYWSFVGNEIIRGQGPTAVDSPFGYLLSGPKQNGKSTAAANVLHVMIDTLSDNAITTYWDLESIGIKDDTTQCNTTLSREAEFESYRDTHLRRENNHFVAKLPWKPNHDPLPTNFHVANNRTRAMIRRLPADIVNIYHKVITDQEKQGFIERVENDNTEFGHYLPHRHVKKDSTTTPIRIVYDCSCKGNNTSPSLNDCLMTGPPLLNDLTSILLRFRANPIALTSDIEKAFLQIRLEPYERKFTKFLWLSDPNDVDSEFVTYQFKSVLFGAVCSPFILNAVIKTQMEADPENQTAADLKQDIYVDDVISGCPTESEAVQYYEESNKLMDSSGFNLRSWSSNSDAVRKLAEKDNKLKSTPCVGTLGMQWDSEKDTLTYKDINTSPDLLTTKGEVVSHTASCMIRWDYYRQYMSKRNYSFRTFGSQTYTGMNL
ncbi:uncharacterized protein [Ptychodera flava]|uniref:uncharacterized protein n=1 Tax=Ptychodera flava TaxID=63121 RepID=UPI00396A275A